MLDRRSIGELANRYSLEPTLRDIYVEGPKDRLFLNWFLRRAGRPGVRTYEIGTVEVPSNTVSHLPITGNAARAYGLAMALHASIGAKVDCVRCIVDKDFSGILYDLPACPFGLVTDFASLDSYAFSIETLRKFVPIFWGKAFSVEQAQSLQECAVELFLLRAAKQLTTPASPWIESLAKYCDLTGGVLRFNRVAFQTDLVIMSGGAVDDVHFENARDELRRRVLGPTLDLIHRDDLVRLLCVFGRLLGATTVMCNQDSVYRALLGCTEFNEIRRHPLFRRLTAWAL